MELFLKTPPSLEPLTLEEVKSFLRISHKFEDNLCLGLIAAARSYVENITGRVLLKQSWQMDLKPPYPLSSPLVLKKEKNLIVYIPRPPLIAIESVALKQQSIPFKQEGRKIILSSHFWDREIQIIFWAGYGDRGDSLPPDLKLSLLLATRFFYDNQKIDLPLLNPFKVFHLI